ncbi:MAG TPA: RNA-directed DNA polymerase [Patescibacteria group bacterium]|nr:RNA-directed DNA polymerase [Patescibacteria group bacterium]
MKSFIEDHSRLTKKFLEKIDKQEIASWLLNEGYYPEQNVLPPSFTVNNLKLNKIPYNLETSKELIKISYPKSNIYSRVFSIQHPFLYHDIVYYLIENWKTITDKLFDEDLKIHSYSFPIPIDTTKSGSLGKLRAGRLIYEWLEMAEKDLIVDAYKYNFIIKSDITNFYKSIYTHSIAWAIHGRKESIEDQNSLKLFGSKIDKFFQYANGKRTNGIPIGSALSDLIAEILLSDVDLRISKRLATQNIKFVATRFKDDYRFLCNTEEDASKIIKALRDELEEFNLLINEEKTCIEKLPQGLYRKHDRDYYDSSLKNDSNILFKTFELTLLRVLDIHRVYRGTSIIEKFLCELLDSSHKLKIRFTTKNNELQYKEIAKTFSLLILLKRESPKALCHVLSIIEMIFVENFRVHRNLKEDIKLLVLEEIKKANNQESEYEVIWYIFFSKYMSLGLNYKEVEKSLNKKVSLNPLVMSILKGKQDFFKDALSLKLFINPKESVTESLAKTLSVFDKGQN